MFVSNGCVINRLIMSSGFDLLEYFYFNFNFLDGGMFFREEISTCTLAVASYYRYRSDRYFYF